MILDMLRIAVWGLSSDRSRIVKVLHDLGVVHLVQMDMKHQNKEPSSLKSLHKMRNLLLGLIEALEWNSWDNLTDEYLEEQRKFIPDFSDGVLKALQESLEEFNERLNKLKNRQIELKTQMEKLRRVLKIAHHFDSFWRSEHDKGNVVGFWWIYETNVSRLLSRLKALEPQGAGSSFETGGLRYHIAKLSESESMIALAGPPEWFSDVEEMMQEENAVRWTPPEEFVVGDFLASVKHMEELYEEIPRELSKIEAELKETRDAWGPKLAAIYIFVEERLEEAIVERSAKTEGYMFCIEGWIPEVELKRTISALKNHFGSRVLLMWRRPKDTEWHEVPTALLNPPMFRSFELFLKLMPPLRYTGIDPTLLIGIFFPFFSGCMVGDVGYGVLIAFAAYFIKKRAKSKLWADVSNIMFFVAFWSVAWGVLFGEYFGDVGKRLFHLEPLWVERSHVVMPVMIFAVSVGLGHVVFGLVLGFIQGLKGKRKHVWLEKLGNLLILLALVGALVTLKGWLPREVFVSWGIVLFIGVVLLIVGGGIGALAESIGAIGNVLSYVRIAAIGLSSAILAAVATKFLDVLGMSIFGLLLALALHLLNFVLAIAGSSLHSARLHYVEFLGKFYEGGGKPYKPFSRRRLKKWKKR
ncbi:V-type ATP synthase subunit I [Thermovirga lienii]|jgi:V/A-type H+-transporting ATPase subunit I|uniref:V-type ATP synthase subunit I n=1 Tax=Thermovirga lienii TaxID=336261 RepID=UPI000749C897|nr:MAG: V-type ATPase [Thermovirga lienii]MDN5318411.1 V/A-type H+/Na+-transporting ATPase subunit [Thermovirga sp.]MDN5368432.1 V/A-type H+/Na+-transporting ATPase subunit [Thermovirga sp.]